MPFQNGRLTYGELQLAKAYARTGDKAYAAHKAGMKSRSGVFDALKRPAVQKEIARQAAECLANEMLPEAIEQHRMLINNPKTRDAVRIQAIKLVYAYTLGKEGDSSRDEHELPMDELIKKLETRMSDLRVIAGEKVDIFE